MMGATVLRADPPLQAFRAFVAFRLRHYRVWAQVSGSGVWVLFWLQVMGGSAYEPPRRVRRLRVLRLQPR